MIPGLVIPWLLLAQSERPETRSLEIGRKLGDTLTSTDPWIGNRYTENYYPFLPIHSKRFRFRAIESGPYFINLWSKSFDAYLIVRDSEQREVASDDDGWHGSNAQATANFAAGEEYSIYACGGLGGIGEFEILLQQGVPSPPSPQEIEPWKDDPRVFISSMRLRGLDQLYRRNRHQEARQLLVLALDHAKAKLGDEFQETAACYYALGLVLAKQGEIAQARSLFEKAIEIQERLLGQEDFQTCDSYVELAAALDLQGHYLESSALLERALGVFRKYPVKDGSYVSYGAMRRCIEIAIRKGEWENAERLLRQAMSFSEAMWGRETGDMVSNLARLGVCRLFQGDRASAKSYFERALTVSGNIKTPLRESLLDLRVRLAEILLSEGNYERAESILRENLEKIGSEGEAKFASGSTLSTLANLYEFQGQAEKARSARQQAFKAIQDSFGGNSRLLTDLCLSLARGEIESLRVAEAKELLEVAGTNNSRDPRPSFSAPTKSLLSREWGRVHFVEGKIEQAIADFEQSLDLARGNPGIGRQIAVEVYLDKGLAFYERGNLFDAVESTTKALVLMRESTRRTLDTLLPSERYGYLITQRRGLDITLHLALQSGDTSAICSAFDALLSWKGQVFQGLITERETIFQSGDRKAQDLLKEIRSVQSQISTLFRMQQVDGIPIAAQRMDDLQRSQALLEKQLQTIMQRSEKSSIGWKELQALLPNGASFVNFIVHRPYLSSYRENGVVVRNPSWGEPIISAWILSKNAEGPSCIRLGLLSEIEMISRKFLSELLADRPSGVLRTNPGADTLNRSLRERVWDPVASRIQGNLVLLSADGCLGSLPFGVLQKEDGRYLVEDYRFVAFQEPQALASIRKNRSEALNRFLFVGAVDFQGADLEFKSNLWQPLPETMEEGTLIMGMHERSFPDKDREQLTGVAATEAQLKTFLSKFSFVHIATHGFFDPERLRSFWDDVLDPERSPWQLPSERRSRFQGLAPGLLSGIVCAGANLPATQGREDGLLTAEEVSWLDMSRCELIVLSACQTGLGTVHGGEGIIGLRSAFRFAGAKAVISSLWSVGDRSTKDLMRRFYRGLWQEKRGKLDALRNAQLEILEEQRRIFSGRTFPYAWGAFVIDGDWR